MANDDRFNPASASRNMFTEAITRALGDYTNAQIDTKLAQKQDTIADLAAIRSGAEAGATAVQPAALAAETSARETADAELHDAVGAVAALGAKNLLKNVRTTTTHRGVTFTVNEDGSVTASGKNDGTGASLFNINEQTSLALSSGDYILTGCPAGGSETGYFMDTTRTSGASLKDTGSGVGFTVGGTYTVNEFRIVISRSVSVSGLVFKPMIRRAEITDDTYAPYAPTNRELYETKITLADVFGAGQLIPDNADLNDYTTGGKYYGGNSAGNSVQNLPIANAAFNFSLEVKQVTPSNTIQYVKICRIADDPYIYIRRKATSWGGWYRFTGEAVASAQSPASLMQAGRLDAELTDAQEVTDDA